MIVASLLAFESRDWPIYLAYFVVALVVLYPPSVEVLPRCSSSASPASRRASASSTSAACRSSCCSLVASSRVRAARTALPARWLARVAAARRSRGAARSGRRRRPVARQFVAEWATFALGLGVRWGVVVAARPAPTPPTATPLAILLAEVVRLRGAGALLSILPIYSDRSLLPLADRERRCAALIAGHAPDRPARADAVRLPHRLRLPERTGSPARRCGRSRRSACTSCCGG